MEKRRLDQTALRGTNYDGKKGTRRSGREPLSKHKDNSEKVSRWDHQERSPEHLRETMACSRVSPDKKSHKRVEPGVTCIAVAAGSPADHPSTEGTDSSAANHFNPGAKKSVNSMLKRSAVP